MQKIQKRLDQHYVSLYGGIEMSTILCDECYTEIRSCDDRIHSDKFKLNFCSKECFDKYKKVYNELDDQSKLGGLE